MSNMALGMLNFLTLIYFVEKLQMDYLISQVIVIILFFPISFLYQSRNVFIVDEN